MISGRHTSKNTYTHTKLHEAVSGHKLYALKEERDDSSTQQVFSSGQVQPVSFYTLMIPGAGFLTPDTAIWRRKLNKEDNSRQLDSP